MTTKVLPSHRLFKQFQEWTVLGDLSFKQFQERIVLGDLSLSEVVRAGAQLMLQHAVELEMSVFLGRDY
jgi:hypothetical protein